MRGRGTVTLSDGTCWENRGEHAWLMLCKHDVQFSRNAVQFPRCFYQRAHTTGLLNFCSFALDICKGKKGKTAFLLLPESPTGSPCRGTLLGRCADQIQMLLECGRGQQRSVEASLQHWLIGVRMKLGVTFLDSDPALSCFLSYLCSHSTPSILSAVRSSPDACVLCTLLRRCGAQRGADSVMLRVWLFASLLLSV